MSALAFRFRVYWIRFSGRLLGRDDADQFMETLSVLDKHNPDTGFDSIEERDAEARTSGQPEQS